MYGLGFRYEPLALLNRKTKRSPNHTNPIGTSMASLFSKESVILFLKVIVSVIIGIEFNHSENAQYLVLALVILICVQKDVPNLIIKKLEKFFDTL